MTPEEFYAAVANIFAMDHTYITPPPEFAKRRWGPRTPGNGRFPGRGLVRFFSPTAIHVALTKPQLSGKFTDAEEALKAIGAAETVRCVNYWFENDFGLGPVDVHQVRIDGKSVTAQKFLDWRDKEEFRS